MACGAARRRRQRRPDVVLDSTPRRVAPPPDGTLRVAGAPQKPCPRRRRRPSTLDGFESDAVGVPGPVVVAGGGGGFCDVLCFEYIVFAVHKNRGVANQLNRVASMAWRWQNARRGGAQAKEGARASSAGPC